MVRGTMTLKEFYQLTKDMNPDLELLVHGLEYFPSGETAEVQSVTLCDSTGAIAIHIWD